MADEAWRAHERRWRQDPADLDALGRAIASLRRSGLVVPADLLDARVEPATRLETALPLEVWAVLPGDREPTTVGWGPGTIEVPPHRYWGVGDVPAGREGLGWLGDELRRRAIPGLRLPQLAPSRRRQDDDDPHLDEDGLAALGPQPQLRWLDLPRRGVQWVTPGEVVRALQCTGLEVFRGEFLFGDTRADEDGEDLGPRLEGFEELRLLRELALDECPLGADDLRALEGLPELDAITIIGAELGAGHLVRAGLAPRLRRVGLDSLHDAELGELSAFAALTSLSLISERLGEELTTALAALPRLSDLRVQANDLPPAGLDDDLARLRPALLTRLHLGGWSSVGDAGLAAALSAPSLRKFEVGARHVHGAPPARTDLRALESLHVQCDGPCWSALAEAGALRELSISGAAADEALDAVGRLSQLTRLSLGVGRASRSRRLELPRLTSLDLRDPMTGTEVQAPLRSLRLRRERRPGTFHGTEGSLRGLERLDLLSGLDDADLATLRTLEGLRVLELRPIDRVGVDLPDRLLELLRVLPGVRRLRLGAGAGPPGALAEVHRVVRGLVSDELPWIAVVE